MGKETKSVLIIDDDKDISETFARILQRNGYLTDSADNGMEALRKADAKFYNVALIDVCLPDMNGTELLENLNAHGGRMVKIIITGFPTMAPKNGIEADAYLLKPVKPQELLSIMSKNLNGN